jgi:hypothetical protein
LNLRIAQKGNQPTEEVFGRLAVFHGVARGSSVQPCDPPFRKPGYDDDANPSVATVTLRLKKPFMMLGTN